MSATATKQPRELSIERQAGITARFIVYYRRNGKPYLDGMYAPTAEQTRRDFLAGAKALGWKNVEIERIEERVKGAA